jgi:hypothetical protein
MTHIGDVERILAKLPTLRAEREARQQVAAPAAYFRVRREALQVGGRVFAPPTRPRRFWRLPRPAGTDMKAIRAQHCGHASCANDGANCEWSSETADEHGGGTQLGRREVESCSRHRPSLVY